MLSPQQSFSDEVLVVSEFAYVSSAVRGRQEQRALALFSAHSSLAQF